MHDVEKGKFTFVVERSAKKNDIKKAIEQKFAVHVVGLSTNIVKGRTARAGKRRLEITYQPFKKAIVALKSGEKINLFDIGA